MPHPDTFAFAPFRLDLSDERLWRGQEVIRLTPKAFAVLRCLTARPGRLVTKDELLDKFRTNASYSMIKPSKVEAVIEMIDHLDDLDDVCKLFALLRK